MVKDMQLSLMQFGADAAWGLAALGKKDGVTPSQVNDLELKQAAPAHSESLAEAAQPIVLDMSEDAKPEGVRGFLYGAAEFLSISITGCAPKR